MRFAFGPTVGALLATQACWAFPAASVTPSSSASGATSTATASNLDADQASTKKLHGVDLYFKGVSEMPNALLEKGDYNEMHQWMIDNHYEEGIHEWLSENNVTETGDIMRDIASVPLPDSDTAVAGESGSESGSRRRSRRRSLMPRNIVVDMKEAFDKQGTAGQIALCTGAIGMLLFSGRVGKKDRVPLLIHKKLLEEEGRRLGMTPDAMKTKWDNDVMKPRAKIALLRGISVGTFAVGSLLSCSGLIGV